MEKKEGESGGKEKRRGEKGKKKVGKEEKQMTDLLSE